MMVMIIERSSVDSGLKYELQSQMVWIKPYLCHLVVLWPWSIHITFLCLGLLIYKIGTTVPISQSCEGDAVGQNRKSGSTYKVIS